VITGTNLTGASAVTIGGAAVSSFTVPNATTINAVTPAGAAGARNVVVTTVGGTGTGVGLYTYIAPPTVSAITPNRGPTAGGTVVTITGSSFSGATSVRFGGVNAAGFTVVNDTTITATTPPNIGGASVVTITGPGGISVVNVTYSYLELVVPASSPATLAILALLLALLVPFNLRAHRSR
jgi:hypothetical protein